MRRRYLKANSSMLPVARGSAIIAARVVVRNAMLTTTFASVAGARHHPSVVCDLPLSCRARVD